MPPERKFYFAKEQVVGQMADEINQAGNGHRATIIARGGIGGTLVTIPGPDGIDHEKFVLPGEAVCEVTSSQ